MGQGPLLTNDGKECTALFISGWNNRNGQYDEELDNLCMAKFNLPFESIRSMWFGRLGELSGYWCYIKLKEV